MSEQYSKQDSKHRVVFITGSTGYMGRTLIHMLAEREIEVRALGGQPPEVKFRPEPPSSGETRSTLHPMLRKFCRRGRLCI